MVYDLTSFEAYFNQFKDQYGIKSVVVGGYDELIKLQNSQIQYKVLVVEIPDESDNLDERITFETRIAVLDMWGTHRRDSEYKTAITACRDSLKLVLDAMANDNVNIYYRPDSRAIEYVTRNQIISGDALFGAICTNVSFTSAKPCV